MTSPHHDPAEDAAFDDFLQGRGELVKQLKALSQLTPSAALDAAILASARAALVQAERSKEVAANDPVSVGKPGFFSRFRMPLAMAASLMAAVLVAVQWHAQQAVQAPVQVAQAPTAEPAPAPAAVAPQLAQVDAEEKAVAEVPDRNMPAAPSPMAAAKQSHPVAESKTLTSEKKIATQVAANAASNEAAKLAAERTDAAPTQLVQADTLQMKTMSAAIQEQGVATVLAPVANATATTSVAGSLARESAGAAIVSAPAAPSAEPSAKAESQDRQKTWLAHIEELIKADARKDALAEWEKFEKAYPDYPVPEKLRAQIKALKN